ncbi:MAG: glycosyltransferase family 4 protein [Anaerolineae bacterium]|jgi:glycosyltransferase involved in cell wall biosynthesis|nr:glycosyltransferase family 4 protein [Anaerolineae bacterium]MBT7075380.1 glycosyltransferase family 4 protein [Anaerolineae bacterium]MBT7783456.1 glycosyltransferase family 4 protein [Anaerolineae bacterium]
MTEEKLRLAGILAGDIRNHPATRIKFGLFFDALARQFDIVDICDSSLHGVARMWNAVQVFHPNLGRWRKRYWQNLPAFRARSRLASDCVHRLGDKVDAVMQIGLLFDANWKPSSVPKLIYTDYTAHLSARRPDAGRSPFTPRQFDEWIRMEERAYLDSAHIFTRGKFVRKSLIDDYGVAPDKITAVGGGVSFSSLPEASFGQEGDPPVALFIGRDFYRKGGDLLLKAFSATRREYPEAKLLVMTRDAIPDDLPMDGVELLSPAWDREMLKKYFQRANLFILPSRLETWGDVLLEAMAYSLPCIGVREAAMPEIIEDGKTGFLINPEDIVDLTMAMKKLFSNYELRKEFGIAARQRVEEKFTWDDVTHLMKTDIQKLGIHF